MVALGVDGSKTETLGPRSGVPGGFGTSVAPTRKDCAADPLQVYCWTRALSAVEAAGMSRHLPLLRFTKWKAPPGSSTGSHCWLAPPEYDQSCTGAASAVDTFVTSQPAASLRLSTRTYPSPTEWGDCWVVLPLHVYCCTAVPSAVPAAAASTHLAL
ncbi:hypothetical protein SMICM304S_11830 [Streptomyces microflavus]